MNRLHKLSIAFHVSPTGGRIAAKVDGLNLPLLHSFILAVLSRAVNAYALARFGGGPAEAVYEALHALNAPAEAAFVLDL